MKRSIRLAAAGVTLALAGLGLVGCSGSSSPGGTSGGDDTGPITVVQGKDNNGVLPLYAAAWNKLHPDQKVTFKQQSPDANQQLSDLLQHFQQKLPDYDVVSSDVVWTSQLAAQGYLQPLTGKFAIDTSGIVPAVLNTAKYNGVLYAAPAATDSQILYYRKDLLGNRPVPTTYAEMFADCDIAKAKGIGCYTGQFFKYEGLTVNFSEAVNSAGGTVVDGKGAPTLDTAAAKQGLQTLVTAFQNGDIPKAALTYKEEDGRLAFDSGKFLFYTNWPYAYSLTNTDTSGFVVKKTGTLGIAGFPGDSSLGGHNWAISAFSKHKATALAFVKWFETTDIQKLGIEKSSAAPVLSALYSDSTLASQYPYLSTLKASLDKAVPRPSTPFYQKVTLAIQNNAFDALNGTTSVDSALTSMSAAIKQASGN